MLIQKLRLQRGWSQEQLAELSGLSARTIQRLERGQPASLETLKALGAAFDVDVSTLKEPDMSPTAATPAAAPHAQAEEALAFAHVRAVKGFYIHAAQYAAVMLFLIVVNLVATPHYFWAIFPVVGWGIGVAFHGMRVFGLIPLLTGDWEKREVEKRLGRKL